MRGSALEASLLVASAVAVCQAEVPQLVFERDFAGRRGRPDAGGAQ